MRKLDIYTFDELPEEYQDYLIYHADEFTKIADSIETQTKEGAEAQFIIDTDIAIEKLTSYDIEVDETEIDRIVTRGNKRGWSTSDVIIEKIDWSMIFEPIELELPGFDDSIYISFDSILDRRNELECIISWYTAEGEEVVIDLPQVSDYFNKSDEKTIRRIYEHCQDFVDSIIKAIENAVNYEIPEDDLRYFIQDMDLEYFIKNDKVQIL